MANSCRSIDLVNGDSRTRWRSPCVPPDLSRGSYSKKLPWALQHNSTSETLPIPGVHDAMQSCGD